MTKIEQDQAEAIVFCLPMIAESLAYIAKSLEALHGNQSDQPKPRDDYV